MRTPAAIIAAAVALSLVPRAEAQIAGKVAEAKPGDVRVIATAAIREPLEAVLKQAEAAIGRPIVVEYGSARGNLREKILGGQDFELALLLPDVDDELAAAGKIAPGRVEIARVPVAFGLRGEAPHLDVSSPAAVKAAMLKAKSVKYAPTGAALMTVKKILSTLDIADKIRDSSKVAQEVPLAGGEYEINIYPISEIIPNRRLENLGAVIAELQVPFVIEATVGKNAADPKSAQALIAFLQGPAIERALKDAGMERPAARPVVRASVGVHGGATVPDFSGIWRHGNLPWFIPPASGPGPVTNLSREKATGVSDYGSLVGDYKNPILKPWAADVVKKKGELSLAGITFPSPSNTCWPEPVPYLFKHAAMEMLQLPDQIVMLFNENHEVRRVRMNASHPAKVTPSWHGDAVAHYEGDTLVIDTVGIRTDRPFAMIDLFGTPYTEKLHVVERYRLVDYEDAKDAMQRGAKENRRAGGPYDPNYKDKYLQVLFTIEDEGAFTMPWTAVMIYLRERAEFPEAVCAENTFSFHNNKNADFPHADKPDF
jgi:molybdate transport system substrate-binding protein